MRKAITVLLPILVVIGAIYWFFLRPGTTGEAQTQLQTVTASRSLMVSEVAASGSIAAEREANLSFKLPGRVAAIHVVEGQEVVEGQPLAELEMADMQLQLRQAQVGLSSAEAQMAKLLAPPNSEDIAAASAAVDAAVMAYNRALEGASPEQVIIAEAQLKKAEVALQRAQAAYDEVKWIGGIAAMQPSLALEAATLDYEAAKANYDLAVKGAEPQDISRLQSQVEQARAQLVKLQRGVSEEDIAIVQAQVEQAKIALEQAELQISNAVLRAPFSGVVASVNIEVGQMAVSGMSAITLLDASRYHIVVNADEADVGTIALGQPATIEIDSFPGITLEGHVADIGLVPLSDEGSAANLLGGGSVVQYPVRVEIDEPFPGLRSGMSTQVVIEVERNENAIVIPNRAVQVESGTGTTYVEKLVNNTPVAVEVLLGLSGDGAVEVLAGVEEGDTIVLREASSLEQLRNTFMPAGGQ